jgi:hypothetical protein
MPRPIVSTFTERLYGRLPDLYREADEADESPDGYPLLRYLSLLCDQAGEVETIVDRVDYITPEDGGDPDDTSDLTDPATASPSWLPWLAQLVGVDLSRYQTVAGRRAAVAGAASGWKGGTRGAIEAAVVDVLEEPVEHIEVFATGPWTIEVRTAYEDNPDRAEVLAAAASAKPAGTTLEHAFITAIEEAWEWTEFDVTVTSNACPIPAPTLLPGPNLFPC